MIECLILAAGEGKRLRPYTKHIPKGLVNLLGKSLISRQIHNFNSLKIKKIAIVTGYKAEKFNSFACKTFHNKYFETTNMVESLFVARSFLENCKKDILISYGDIVYEKKP